MRCDRCSFETCSRTTVVDTRVTLVSSSLCSRRDLLTDTRGSQLLSPRSDLLTAAPEQPMSGEGHLRLRPPFETLYGCLSPYLKTRGGALALELHWVTLQKCRYIPLLGSRPCCDLLAATSEQTVRGGDTQGLTLELH